MPEAALFSGGESLPAPPAGRKDPAGMPSGRYAAVGRGGLKAQSLSAENRESRFT